MSTADEVVVATCRPADAAAVEALFVAYRHFYGCADDDAEAAAFVRARLSRGESQVMTAATGGRVVGFCQVYREFSSLRLRLTWVLNDLFVSPEGRGCGAGRALVLRTLREARGEGATAVVLETQASNEVAQGLYRSVGFVESHRDGDFVHYRHDLEGADHA